MRDYLSHPSSFLFSKVSQNILQVTFYFCGHPGVKIQITIITVEGVQGYCTQNLFFIYIFFLFILTGRNVFQCDICTVGETNHDMVFIFTSLAFMLVLPCREGVSIQKA